MTEILAKYRTPRKGRIRLVVVHVNEGPDRHGGAVGVAQFCQLPASKRDGKKGGYHEYVDDVQLIIGGHVDDVVNGAAGANKDGYHICLIGDADQTDAQWHDEFSKVAGVHAAARVRNACLTLGVPMELLTTEQVKAGKSGVCGHVNVSEAFKRSDHTDPGRHFPWTEFMQVVKDGEDMPLNDADKKFIFETVLGILRSEGVSGANALNEVDRKFIADTVLQILRSEGVPGNAQTAAVEATKVAKQLGA
jgi:hypothetical protein